MTSQPSVKHPMKSDLSQLAFQRSGKPFIVNGIVQPNASNVDP